MQAPYIILLIIGLVLVAILGWFGSRYIKARKSLSSVLDLAEQHLQNAQNFAKQGDLQQAWQELDGLLPSYLGKMLQDPEENILWLQFPEQFKRLLTITNHVAKLVFELSEDTSFAVQKDSLKRLQTVLADWSSDLPKSVLEQQQDARDELADLIHILINRIKEQGRARLEQRPSGQRELILNHIQEALLQGDLAQTRLLLPDLLVWPFAGDGKTLYEDLDALAQVSSLLQMEDVSDAAIDALIFYPELEATCALSNALIAQDMAPSAARLLHGCWISYNLDADSTIAYSDVLLAMQQPGDARAVLMSAGLLHAEVMTDPRLSQRLSLIDAQLKRMN